MVKSGAALALRRLNLGLSEGDRAAEVGSAEISNPEISPGEVGCCQAGAAEVGPDEVCPSQVGAAQIGAAEIGPDEVGSAAADLAAPCAAAHEFARAYHQDIDGLPVCCHVQFRPSAGTWV